MELHTFTARSLPEALRLVRQELGPEASVLHTREVGTPLARWWGGRRIEVTASAEVTAPSRFLEAPSASPSRARYHVAAERVHVPGAELQDFRRRIRDGLVRGAENGTSLVEQLAGGATTKTSSLFPSLEAIEAKLRRAGVGCDTARRWLARLNAELACDPEAHSSRTWERLKHIVAAELPVQGAIRTTGRTPAVVALLGPTGVGKTTTLAKLAAHFRIHEAQRVALIAADSYRIAAVEQLQAYAQIMDLPLEVVAAPSDMSAAVERLAAHDLVLIDTAGVSPHDTQRLLELQEMLAAAQAHEMLLVWSCTAEAASLVNAVQAFGGIGATGLILTKLDEVPRLGQLIGALTGLRLPVAYTTHGQNVPHDIQPASATQLADLLLTS